MKKKIVFISILLTLVLLGCKGAETVKETETVKPTDTVMETENQEVIESQTEIPEVAEVDYSASFEGLDGCAVLYDGQSGRYTVYNQPLAETQASPCSTFKIVSALIGLENGIVTNADDKLGYDGTEYAVEAWNKDLTLNDAFSSSCVWYFRKLIDQAGEDAVGQMLGRLHYGNCDISQWEGSGLNPMPQLNGFWLESSLMISPKEQVEVLSNIFEGKTGVSEHSLEVLKKIMYRESVGDKDIYGKTGSGSQNAWFVGFTEENGKRVYFAVRITGEGENVHGNKAMEIALTLLNK